MTAREIGQQQILEAAALINSLSTQFSSLNSAYGCTTARIYFALRCFAIYPRLECLSSLWSRSYCRRLEWSCVQSFGVGKHHRTQEATARRPALCRTTTFQTKSGQKSERAPA